jgi:cytochrome-b5 reductase
MSGGGGGATAPASKEEQKNAPANAGDRVADKPAPKAFTGGDQGFLDLKLLNVETVNHNTKRFRFELPDKDQVSGLNIACQ